MNFNLIKTLNLKFEKNMIQDFLFLYQKNVASHINLKRNHLKIINDILVSSFKKKKVILFRFFEANWFHLLLFYHVTKEIFLFFMPQKSLLEFHQHLI